MLDVMFELPDVESKSRYVVTPEIVRKEKSLFDSPKPLAAGTSSKSKSKSKAANADPDPDADDAEDRKKESRPTLSLP